MLAEEMERWRDVFPSVPTIPITGRYHEYGDHLMCRARVWILEKPKPWWKLWGRTPRRAVVILGDEPGWIEMEHGERRARPHHLRKAGVQGSSSAAAHSLGGWVPQT